MTMLGDAKKYLYKILTDKEVADPEINTEKFRTINTVCAPQLQPFYNLNHCRWEWRLIKDWEVNYDGETYIVPEGFETDGATIPRILWPIFGTPTQLPRLYVALLHDYLYTIGPKKDKNPSSPLRKRADRIYKDFNIQLGEPKLRTLIEYRFVRWFGWTHWKIVENNPPLRLA